MIILLIFVFLSCSEKAHDKKEISCGNSKFCGESRFITCQIEPCFSALTEEIKTNPKAKFKVANKFRISKYKNIFSKGYSDDWSREIFKTDSV